MNRARIVADTEGPALLVPAGEAAVVASAIGRLLEVRPAWAGPDRVLVPLRRALLEVEHLAACSDLKPPDPPAQFPYVSAATAARVTGESPQSVTRKARLGRIPGAHHVPGLGWLIPADALPEPEEQ